MIQICPSYDTFYFSLYGKVATAKRWKYLLYVHMKTVEIWVLGKQSN